mgnify:CR=1 FL=1
MSIISRFLFGPFRPGVEALRPVLYRIAYAWCHDAALADDLAGLPPTLILHGRADTTVPFASAEAFAAAMKKAGNRCELVGYEGQPHGFFNAVKFDETLADADKFLVSLGYLTPATSSK